MAVILNASTSSGFVQSADTSGVLTLQNNGTDALSVNSGNLQFNSGYGSVATAYGCRAWVCFNGTGTPAIRASGNVSSITDNGGFGDYTVNFTTAMPDANYAVCTNASASNNFDVASYESASTTRTASLVRTFFHNNGSGIDPAFCSVAVFR